MIAQSDPGQLRRALDDLAARSTRHLASWALRRDVRVTAAVSLVWILAVPIALFVTQTALVLLARTPFVQPLWVWALLALAGPIFFIAARVVWLGKRRQYDRRTALGVYDGQLDTNDRLVTADEFIGTLAHARPSASGDSFRAAAIEDASDTIQRALVTPLAAQPLPAWSVPARHWAAVPAAIALVAAALWLGRLAVTIRQPVNEFPASLAVNTDTLPARLAARLLDLRPSAPRPEKRNQTDPAKAGENQSAPDSSPPSLKSTQQAEGESQTGGQASSKSSSQSTSSPGTPSNQQMPSPPLDDDPPRDPTKPSTVPPKKTEGVKTQMPSSATSGQGQTKSSSLDKSAIPSSDQPDRAGINKDDGADEAGVQDEVEEEKTTAVERPSLRKNKPPVDRNLSPRPTGDQPNPNANGRSGPGGRKKTRGVPSMILGVPTPDRIQGMTNPGRSKVTQENSTPKEEPQAALTAEQRRARDAAFGFVDHPLLQPWMLSLVEQYFLQARGKAPAPPSSANKGSR
jgi:hypothetical protein